MSIRVFAIVTLRHGSRGKHITPCYMFPRTSLFIIVLGDEEEDKFVDALFCCCSLCYCSEVAKHNGNRGRDIPRYYFVGSGSVRLHFVLFRLSGHDSRNTQETKQKKSQLLIDPTFSVSIVPVSVHICMVQNY